MNNYRRNVHFCGPDHKMADCKVQIIFHAKTDDFTKDVLLSLEKYCMRMRSTLYPLVLDDNVKSININIKILNNFIVLIRLSFLIHHLFKIVAMAIRK